MDPKLAALLGIVRTVATNQNFQQSAIGMLQMLGQQLASKVKDPDAHAIVSNMITNAPALVGAMVKGTRAEALVNPQFIPTHTDVAALASGHKVGVFADLAHPAERPFARTD